jgi:PAS domain S-box-containing protein
MAAHVDPSGLELGGVSGRCVAALNAAPLFVYSLSPDGRLLMAVGNGLERLGLRCSDLVGVSVAEAFAHDPGVLRELHEVLVGRRRSSCHVADLGLDLESWLTPILDEAGRLVEVVGVSLDVAELRAAQRELAARERFLAEIIDSLPAAVSVRDSESRYVVVNRLIAERSGRDVRDILGRTLVETWGEAGDELAESDRRIIESGDPEGTELVVSRDSDPRHLRVRRSVITLPNGEPGVLTVGEDITERIRGLAALEVGEAKSRFFAAVSHELRAPLNSVLGFAQLLAGTDATNLTPRQARYVENIRAGGSHLLTLINDLLDLSRLEVGKLDLHLEPVMLSEAVRDVVERMGPVAADKSVELKDGSSRSRPMVLADRRRVDQVLFNLVSNAIKFTPTGGTVTVRAGTRGGAATLSVQDTGIGIPAADQERIFDEFIQLENELVRTQTGTGLGLSVTRGLVAPMGGSIEVCSAAGRGSTFTVILPSAPRKAHRTVGKKIAG